MLVTANDDKQHRIAKLAYDSNIALIVAQIHGLFAKVFCDFGENFIIRDQGGGFPCSTDVVNLKPLNVAEKKSQYLIFDFAKVNHIRTWPMAFIALRKYVKVN